MKKNDHHQKKLMVYFLSFSASSLPYSSSFSSTYPVSIIARIQCSGFSSAQRKARTQQLTT